MLLANTKALVAYWHARGVNPTPDLVTTSGSGLDPDITPQDAIVQIPMVSAATGISPSALRALIAKETKGEQLGLPGHQLHRRPAAERGARPAPVTGWEPTTGDSWGGRPVARRIADGAPRRRHGGDGDDHGHRDLARGGGCRLSSAGWRTRPVPSPSSSADRRRCPAS